MLNISEFLRNMPIIYAWHLVYAEYMYYIVSRRS